MSARKRRIKNVTQPDNQLVLLQEFEDFKEPAQLDLLTDLDDAFFATAFQLIHHVAEVFGPPMAGKLKQYVDLLARMHIRYVTAVETTKLFKEQVESAEVKLRLALETTGTSDAMFQHLRDALEEAWRTADAVEYRESTMQAQLLNLAQKEHEATKRGANIESENPIETKLRRVILRERDRLAGELKEYTKRLEMNRYYSESLELIIQAHRDTIMKQQMSIKMMGSEKFKLEHRYRLIQEGYEDQLLTMQKELNAAMALITDLKHFEKEYEICKQANDRLKQNNDRITHENITIQKTFHRLEEDKAHMQLNIALLEDMARVQKREAGELDARYRDTQSELKRKNYETSLLKRRFQQISRKHSELTEHVVTLENHVLTLDKKLGASLAKLDDMTHQRDDIARSRDKLRLEMVRINDLAADMKHDIVLQRNEMQNLHQDIERGNKKLDEKEQALHKLNREKNEIFQETVDLSDKIERLEENLQNKIERLALLNERLQQKQQDYMSVKKQMESIHSEKVVLQKNLDVCSRDRQNLHNVNAKMAHQIHQMTNEIAANEKDLNALHCRIEQMNNVIKQKISEIHNIERMLHSTRSDLKEMKIRYEQAQHTIDQDEKRFKKMTYNLDEVRKEKTLVGLQMMRRNDELRLLKERIEMMQVALDRGTSQYNQRIEDIRLLKLEIMNLNMSRSCMKRAIESTANMRHEVVRLERHLNRERLRVTAFTEELARPCRIHRWRVLLGKDPKKFDLIRKIQVLLKRNIRLNIDRVNMAQKVHEVQRLYDTLKQQLRYMPDPSIKRQLMNQQILNRKQTQKLKAIKAELAINEIDLQSRDCIIESYQQTIIEKMQKCYRCKNAIGCRPCHNPFIDCCTDEVIKVSSSEEKFMEKPNFN